MLMWLLVFIGKHKSFLNAIFKIYNEIVKVLKSDYGSSTMKRLKKNFMQQC